MRQTHISFRRTRTQRYERDQRRGQQSCQSDDRRELKERDSARNVGIGERAREDASRSKKALHAYSFSPTFRLEVKRGGCCRLAGLESLNKEPKGCKGLGAKVVRGKRLARPQTR